MEHVGKRCVVVMRGHDDFSVFFNGQFGKIIEHDENGVKVKLLLAPKCTLELDFDEVLVF